MKKLLSILFLFIIFACKQQPEICSPATDKLKQAIDSGCFNINKKSASAKNKEMIEKSDTNNFYNYKK